MVVSVGSPSHRPGRHECTLAGDVALGDTTVGGRWGIVKRTQNTGNNTTSEGTGRDGRQARRVAASRKPGEESLFSGEVWLIRQKGTGKYWI